MGILNIFKRYKVSFLDEKWELIKEDVRVFDIPRTHEVIYLISEKKYYRVVNVIHNIDKNQEIYIVIEEYTDDYALINKKEKNNSKNT